ncbi:MAG: HAMP domain-containing sensor histidine kinase [Clostridia bacterium]
MKSPGLRSRIFLPFLALMVLMPIGAYFVFRFVSERYATNLAHSELLSTLESVRALVDDVYVTPNHLPEDDPEVIEAQARDFLYQMRVAIRRSQFESSVIVLNRHYEQVYPSAPDEEYTALAACFDPKMAADAFQDKPLFKELTLENRDYIACLLRLSDPEQVLSNYLIVFSSVNDTSSLLRTSSLFVLLITAVLAFAALALSWAIATGISQPIDRLREHVARIGAGDFRQMAQLSGVREVNELIEATNRTAVRLARYDEAQKTFFQNASHELRTPLMSIQGYAEGIELGVWEDPKQAAGVIADESKRLTALVDELLTLSRLDNHQQSVEIESIELRMFLGNTLDHLAGIAQRQNIKFLLTGEIGDAYVEADEQLLTKAVSNVLSNAIRYARAQVTLVLAFSAEWVTLTVKDDGPGISQESLERVFDRFYKGEGGHCGIGLSVARSAMDYIGGQIQVLPSEVGAAFELKFVRTKRAQ